MTDPGLTTRPARSVVIDYFPSSAARYRDDHVVVAVDVIRATTMAVTALALGRRCIIAADVDDAYAFRDSLGGALLAGEVAGDRPPGFDINNSPAALSDCPDTERPLVMLSSSGTALMIELADARTPAFVACLRNIRATVAALLRTSGPIALIGAGSRGQFREEDQLACAWLARGLLAEGCVAADEGTSSIIDQWGAAPAGAAGSGDSVAYLRRSGQLADFTFIVDHVDDVAFACRLDGREVKLDGAVDDVPGIPS